MRGDGLQQAEVPVHGPQPTKDDPYQSTRQALAGPTTSNEAARPAPDVPAQPMESTLTTAAVGGAAIKPPEQKSSIQQEFDLQEMARLADYTYGERSPEAGAARAKLAGFYRANGDNKRADAYYQAAIERLGRSSDNFYVQILTGTLNDYAAFKKDMGQTSESAQLKKRSDAIHNLSVSEAELSQAATNGEPDSNIADKLAKHAAALHGSGFDDRAEKEYKMSIEMLTNAEGPNSAKLLPVLRDYQKFLKDTGKIDFELADRITALEKLYGSDQKKDKPEDPAGQPKLDASAGGAALTPEAGTTTEPQGPQNEETKDDKDSTPVKQSETGTPTQTGNSETKEQEIGSTSGSQDPLVNNTTEEQNPSQVLPKPEPFDAYKAQRNLLILERTLGQNSPQFAEALAQVGQKIMQSDKPDLQLAGQMYWRSANILEGSPPADPYHLCESLRGYEKVLEAQGKTEEAKKVEERIKALEPLSNAQTAPQCSLMESPAHAVDLMASLAQGYANSGNYGEADRLYRESISSARRDQVPEADLKRIMLDYAKMLRASGKPSDAEGLEQEAEKIKTPE